MKPNIPHIQILGPIVYFRNKGPNTKILIRPSGLKGLLLGFSNTSQLI